MAEKLTIDFSQAIPVFPLPGCVLLPHATVPLHIFEDRYRRMVHDALDSHGLIAMALFDGDRWKLDYRGCPPVRPHVCVGYIVRHEQLGDGRYNILLQGICRARILKEIEHAPYRRCFLEPTEPSLPMEIDLEEHRGQIESLLGDSLLKELASVSAIHNWISNEIPTPALIDLALMTVCCNAEQRYTMLADGNTFARASWLEQWLREARQTLVMSERFRVEPTSDGAYPN